MEVGKKEVKRRKKWEKEQVIQRGKKGKRKKAEQEEVAKASSVLYVCTLKVK